MKQIVLVVVATFFLATTGQSQTVYFSDFEADNGGLSASGDWEWGMPIGADGTALGGFGGVEPTGGFSGDNVWGTILGGLHNPSTTSILGLTVDLTGINGSSLSFYEWSESGGNTFDMASVTVNSDQVYLSDGNSNQDWRLVDLDLSAYDGLSSVNIEFGFETTGVVERVGWYIDDVHVSGAIPEPTAFGLLAVGAVAAISRRKR